MAPLVRELRKHYKVVLLSGDSDREKGKLGRLFGEDVPLHFHQTPADKLAFVARVQAQGEAVLMVGDGLNDAGALKQADVGVAMGTGTDVAMENAGVTLVKGDLRGIVRARRLSIATMRNIRQNLFFAFVYNMIGVPVAAGLLYPFFGLLLSPMLASAAMTFSSLSVISNALRLRHADL